MQRTGLLLILLPHTEKELRNFHEQNESLDQVEQSHFVNEFFLSSFTGLGGLACEGEQAGA